MSQEESLRLAAEVVNKWAGPLRDLQRSLSDQQNKTHIEPREKEG
jgi:hypothetical protein